MNRIIKAIAIHLKCLYYKMGGGIISMESVCFVGFTTLMLTA